MGFFSELKEDLSQAVNDLLTEDETLAADDEQTATEETNGESETKGAVYFTPGNEERTDGFIGTDSAFEQGNGYSEALSAMLDKLEMEEKLSEEDELEEDKKNRDNSFENPEVGHIETEEVLNETEEGYAVEKMGKVEKMEEAVFAAHVNEKKALNRTVRGKGIAHESSVIMGGMIVNGNVTSEGSLDLDGTVIGDIEIAGKLNITGYIKGNARSAEVFADNAKIEGELKSMGSVKIGQGTVVVGNVYGMNAVIAGAVKGDIDVQGPVIVDGTAIILGNIKSKSVQINNGAVIEGKCSQTYAEVNPTSFFDEFSNEKNEKEEE